MRRLGMSLLFSALALVGGANGAMLCLHEAGAFHVTTSPEAVHDAPGDGLGESGDACHTAAIDRCDWHLDVEVEGLNLGQPQDWGGAFTRPAYGYRCCRSRDFEPALGFQFWNAARSVATRKIAGVGSRTNDRAAFVSS